MGLNDVSGSTGIQGALNKLLQSFNNWQAGPQSDVTRNDVIQQARSLAQTISQVAGYVQQTRATAQTQAQTTVTQINQLVGGVKQWNNQLQAGAAPDPGAEAAIYNAFEQLSALAPITIQKQSNGLFTVLLNGQTPLLQGGQQFSLQTGFAAPPAGSPNPSAQPSLTITDAHGNDVTSLITGGQLGGLLDYVNRFVPSLLGNANQQGDLNRLAQGIADSTNNALGGPTPLFQYTAGDPTHVAQSLTVASSFSAVDLAADQTANPNAPQNLARIATGTNPADQIDGQKYTDFFTTLSSRVNSDLNGKQNGLDLQNQLLNQAQNLRDHVQGVSLDQEAVNLLQYQRSFEAAARLISVLDNLTQTAIGMLSAT
jgi:flagellar hook-associated protein 1 FlgK